MSAAIIPFPAPEQQTCYACIYYAPDGLNADTPDEGWCLWFDSEVDEDVDGVDCGEYES